MKINILFAIIVFISLSLSVFGQEYYSAISDNGLIIRIEPNMEAKRVSKLACGEDLSLIKKTGIKVSITDKNKKIDGSWYYIKSNKGIKGYVFSGFLLQKKTKPEYEGICDEHYGKCDTKISFSNFDFIIYNYQKEGVTTKHDTLVIYEAVFNEIGDKLIQIKPKADILNVDIYYARIESLNSWGSEKNSQGIVPRWKGHDPFINLSKKNSYYFRIPTTNYDEVRNKTVKRMNLKEAPNFHESGEGWWIPRYIYKGIIAPYQIESVLLKVVTKYKSGDIKVKYVELNLSYGC